MYQRWAGGLPQIVGASEPTDGLVLTGGLVIDPESESLVRSDVRVTEGRFAAYAPTGTGDEEIDVSGLIVTPGLVDLHTHVFHGQDLGLVPDDLAFRSGTTTLIDAGSAGGHLFDAFRRSSVDGSAARVRAFLNISSIGTTSIRLSGELRRLEYSDIEVAVSCVERNRDLVLGVKVRASDDVGGVHAPEALRRAREASDRVGLPLMVHLGPAPADIDEIADTLRAGDILTHAFTGWPDNSVVSEGGLRPSVRAARDRGVLLDIGHGMSGFSAEVARTMVALGEYPDTISTDLHAYSRAQVVDLPTVLSKFIALGMTVEQVLARATLAPARAVGLADDGVGSMRIGAPADLAVFRLESGHIRFDDGFGNHFPGTQRLVPVFTMMNGRVVFDRLRGGATSARG